MNLVLTIAIGEHYQDMALITHSSVHCYAQKIGAGFFSISKQMISKTSPHWEKFRLYDLLEQYDRIIYIDTDVIIKRDCPDLFKIVPEDSIGAFNEGQHFPRRYQDYYNTGVLVVSRCHRDIFVKPEIEKGSIDTFFEQDTLNDLFMSSRCKMFSLPYQFNKMDFIQAPGYIIHKAGNLNALAELQELSGVLA